MSWRSFCEFIASGFYAGRLRPAPGTWGTAVGLLLYVAVVAVSGGSSVSVDLIATLVVSVLAVFFSEQACRLQVWGVDKDPQTVVIDEIAGYFVAICGIGASPLTVCAAFVLFRFFDVLKPTPIRQVQGVPGGWGIVLDDLLAGLFANLVLRTALLLV